MCRSTCLLLLALSVSAVVAEPRDFLKYIVPEELENGVTYEFDLESRALIRLDAANCTRPGRICDGCTKVYECVQIGGGFIIIALDDCAIGTTCLQATGTCTINHNTDCDEDIIGYRFVCRQIGLFPDAFNCQLYHMCTPGVTTDVNPISIPLKCDHEFYYDARTTLCRNQFVNGNCADPTPVCKDSGDVGVLAANPAQYYLCAREGNSTSYFPQIFVCANNQEYSVSQRACVDPTTDLTTALITDATTDPIIDPTTVGPDGKCTTAGTFYDPDSCFSSYECENAGDIPVKKACAANTHFDPITQTCIEFTCSDVVK